LQRHEKHVCPIAAEPQPKGGLLTERPYSPMEEVFQRPLAMTLHL
jgi:hypothetical protein